MIIALVATAIFLPTHARRPDVVRRSLDPFRALRYPALLLTGLTAIFYNIGFFTLLAAGPFALPDASIIAHRLDLLRLGPAAGVHVGVRRAAGCSG